jgi:hypothetical protein
VLSSVATAWIYKGGAMSNTAAGSVVAVAVCVLLAACVATELLAWRAQSLRQNEPDAVVGRLAKDYTSGIELGKSILGFAVALGGFFGLALGGKALKEGTTTATTTTATTTAAVGLGGVLAGASLMEPVGWAVPVALAALAVAGGAVMVAKIRG